MTSMILIGFISSRIVGTGIKAEMGIRQFLKWEGGEINKSLGMG